MLGNEVALWEIFLACMKLGVVVTPATTLLTTVDLQDRVDRGRVSHAVAGLADAGKARRRARIVHEDRRRRAVGRMAAVRRPSPRERHVRRDRTDGSRRSAVAVLHFGHDGAAQARDAHASELSVGHLSTLYWLGLQPGDRHWNISSPGWAKHAWSCVFAPWNAQATGFVFNYARFNARAVLRALAAHRVTTLCAPPTVWRC
jgi:acetyl-CoA synthetase